MNPSSVSLVFCIRNAEYRSLTGVWTPTLIGIALMFGIGNAFDSVVSAVAYGYFLKKNKYNILRVE